jgi:hypothetical protein
LQVQTVHADDGAERADGSGTATTDSAVHDDGTDGSGQAAAADWPATANGQIAADDGTAADSWPSVNDGPAADDATATDRDGQQIAGQQRMGQQMGQPTAGYGSLCFFFKYR